MHLNSGIAKLAFKLMAPRHAPARPDKTTVNVPALSGTAMTSIDMGAKIWYRALDGLHDLLDQLRGARTATASAAPDLYGATRTSAVHAVRGTPSAFGRHASAEHCRHADQRRGRDRPRGGGGDLHRHF